MSVQGITEEDIANFLAQTPGFFERHAQLLSTVQLTSPHGQRAVSLQERQMEMLREKIKGLEHKLIEMIRHGQDNVAIADRLHRWTRALLCTANTAELPEVLVRELKHEFMIPQAALRVWGVADAYQGLPTAQPVSADLRTFAASLSMPYCGVNSGFEALQWLAPDAPVASLAMIPLRRGEKPWLEPALPGQPTPSGGGSGAARPSGHMESAFGLLLLGSPDPTRYGADMGTDFLERMGDVAAAGLSRLLPG